MSHDEEFAIIPRPGRVPSIADAVPPSVAIEKPEKPKKRSEVVAAGALFMALLAALGAAVGVVSVAIF